MHENSEALSNMEYKASGTANTTQTKVTVLGRRLVDLLVFNCKKTSYLQEHETGSKLLCAFLENEIGQPEFRSLWGEPDALVSLVELRSDNGKYTIHRQQSFDAFNRQGPPDQSILFRSPTSTGSVPQKNQVSSPVLLIEDPEGDLLSAKRDVDFSNGQGSLVFYKIACLRNTSWGPDEESKLIKSIKPGPIEQLVIIINADDLRPHRTSPLSWEQAAIDILEYFDDRPISKILHWAQIKCIIRLGYVGAIVLEGSSRKLYFDGKHKESGFAQVKSVTSAALQAAFLSGLVSKAVQEPYFKVEEAIGHGLRKARYLASKGFSLSENDYLKYPELNSNCGEKVELECSEIPAVELANWTILRQALTPARESLTETYEAKVLEACEGIVAHGIDSERALPGVPIATFGKLVAVDRAEIECYQAIANRVENYLNTPQDRPLSIGVFGAPGSGKSFGIKQIIQTITKRVVSPNEPKKYPVLDYNVSQFLNYSDLLVALQTVRDETVSGRIPIVCFDEFDTTLNGELGWLKFFLAPMQDGRFSEQGHSRPIGQAIFIFIGGTASSFKEFQNDTIQLIPAGTTSPSMPAPDTQSQGNRYKAVEDAKAVKAARAVKKPDFISRLGLHLDVQAYDNPKTTTDLTYMFRRAILIRAKLEEEARKRGEEVRGVDPSVLRGLLKVDTYKHGARSIETILKGSAKGFLDRNALPPDDQLSLHLGDVVQFWKIIDEHLKAQAPTGQPPTAQPLKPKSSKPQSSKPPPEKNTFLEYYAKLQDPAT
ncbi:hypothetical protein ASPACDRAFT_1860640 [Aspergillus aculeatus ATCC 16872]|uniref:ATPase AAA-type core domain-containing protein n=1 Tax=Aspergillus aculeatus (strain ATCC 16872 / CBS 172.66 / WB 5094) TaxID=690307 RepID=A0A1L9WFQ9_ASPA1|nr:uncharacterized protein ASPACDRAFT_1860640 [Aspergillus aculeatus ATCC 16872]OJJ94983.1 hypothetical protein ASPACDRAFT_1860640 [Aspergillus aculeatus ATCC 16872]